MNDELPFRPQELLRKGIAGMIFACLIMSLIILLSDSETLGETIEKVHWQNLLWAGFLALGVYIGRFLKWMFFCQIISVRISWLENLSIFLSGLALGITPGKIGEVLKCYILKRKYDIDFSHTSPTIIGERLSGLLGCFILSLAVVFYHGINNAYTIWIGVVVCDVLLTILTVFRSSFLADKVFFKLSKVNRLKKKIDDCRKFYESTVKILGIKALIVAIFISIIYWLFECMIFYTLISGMEIDISKSQAILILTVTSIGSGLTMLPGSVGALEGGLIGLLVFYGVDMEVAGGVVILHRFFAMWDVLLIGWMVLMIKWRDYGLGSKKYK